MEEPTPATWRLGVAGGVVCLLAIAGPHDRDPRALPVTLHDRAAGRALKVGLCADPPGGSTHPGTGSCRRG